jgi:diguanylate cyclase (GGDEF)-like protein
MSARQPLLSALRAAHLRLGLAAVTLLGLMLTLLSFLTLRTYVDQNLTMVARSIAYSAEAAAVFGDAEAARDVVTLIASREGLLSAELRDAQGRPLASYRASGGQGMDLGLVQSVAARLSPHARVPITVDGRDRGTVDVQGNGGVYLFFLLKVLAAIALCVAAIGWLVSGLSRRIDRDVVQPLKSLAALTRRARLERALELRAPPAVIREIHELGEDFDALLAEIQSREALLVAKHDHLRTANESLSYLAFHDQLTGLPNRASFNERIGRLAQTPAGGTEKAALMYLDCDRFKSINDSLGHAAGDALLVAVAQRIRAHVRDSDFVARLGGDEFAVVLAPVRAAEDAARIAAHIAASIQMPIEHPEHGRIESSASIGVVLWPDHAESVGALVAAADAAMYRAKAQGAGSVVVFDVDMDDITRPMLA